MESLKPILKKTSTTDISKSTRVVIHKMYAAFS